MLKLENVLLMSDLDGTLLNNKKIISEGNLEAINRIIEAGGSFSVATGRSPESANRWLKDLPINAPCVFYNGALVLDYHSKNVIDKHYLDENFPDSIREIMKSTPSTVVQIYTDKGLYLTSDPQYKDPYIEDEKQVVHYVTIEELIDVRWIKVLLYNPVPSLLKKNVAILDANLCSSTYNRFYSKEYFYEITPTDCTKGTAITKIKNIDDFKDKLIIGIGDFENDLEMIKMADFGVAVDNAPNNVKEVADYITVNNDNSPLLDAIIEFEKRFK